MPGRRADREASRLRSCVWKIRYHTALEAVRAAARACERSGDYIAPYSCRFCHGWHIGHPPKRNC